MKLFDPFCLQMAIKNFFVDATHACNFLSSTCIVPPPSRPFPAIPHFLCLIKPKQTRKGNARRGQGAEALAGGR